MRHRLLFRRGIGPDDLYIDEGDGTRLLARWIGAASSAWSSGGGPSGRSRAGAGSGPGDSSPPIAVWVRVEPARCIVESAHTGTPA